VSYYGTQSETCGTVRGPLGDRKSGRDNLPADAGSTIVFSLNNDMILQGQLKFQKKTIQTCLSVDISALIRMFVCESFYDAYTNCHLYMMYIIE